MTGNQLIAKIRKLSQIKPKKDWVVLTKSRILPPTTSRERSFWSIFSLGKWWGVKPALAGFFVVFMIFGLLGFAKNSLPGDPLYIIRKVAHLGQAILTPEAEKPAYQLELANERLEDLAKAPAKNLAPTINEFQANISQAARNLAQIDATTSDPVAIKKIIDANRELEKNIQKATSLGVVVGDGEIEEYRSVFAEKEVKWVEDIIERLKNQASLNVLEEKKEILLNKMKELAKEEKYSDALILYLENQ